MHIELKAGEQIEISFKDADGVITVAYGKTIASVHADLPDTHGRDGVIYWRSSDKPAADSSDETLLRVSGNRRVRMTGRHGRKSYGELAAYLSCCVNLQCSSKAATSN